MPELAVYKSSIRDDAIAVMNRQLLHRAGVLTVSLRRVSSPILELSATTAQQRQDEDGPAAGPAHQHCPEWYLG